MVPSLAAELNVAMKPSGLRGKTALVTGSTSGIGLGIARAFAGAGMNAVLNGFGSSHDIDAARSQLEQSFGVATKLNPDWEFLCRLRDVGRNRTAQWLDKNFDRVGRDSSIDLAEVFL